jgi:hypothetical protein
MIELKVTEEEISQLVGKGKDKNYTHIFWANGVAKL